MKYQILQGDNRTTLKSLPDNSIDAIVTDPPYGIDFLGKSWDANTGALETYAECLRVLKPGGHILAFSAARTYHHLAVTLEQAGFEIRDQIMWIYSSGFPKSQDIGRSIDRSAKKGKFIKTGRTRVSGGPKETPNGPLPRSEETIHIPETPEAKQWAGWGTALKPAHEPIALARKPIKLSIAKNAQQWGTGALNIDATRVPNAEGDRFPSNVIGEILQDDYQKYFYCPKVSRRERHSGFDLDLVPTVEFNDPATIHLHPLWTPAMGKNVYRLKQAIEQQQTVKIGNNHPTVKPIELMKYLIKLVTPPGGIVLDPFNGSGSTGCAAVELGHEYIGCELDPKYVEISLKRIAEWNRPNNNFDDIFE